MKLRELINIAFKNWTAKILALVVAVILFAFNRITTLQERVVMVPLKVLVPQGYALSDLDADEISCVLQGEPDSQLTKKSVSELASLVKVYCDFSDQEIQETRYNLKVRYSLNEAARNWGVFINRISPAVVTVRIEKEISKTVQVEANITGAGEIKEGYILSEYSIDPKSVEIRGPRTKINNIKSLTTAKIDLTGRSSDYTTLVGILIPEPHIIIVGTDNIQFTGIITEKIITKIYTGIAIDFVEKRDYLILDPVNQTATLELKGPELLLKDIRYLKIRLVINMSDIYWAGEYTMKTIPDIPADVVLLNYSPKYVLVKVRQ